MTRLAASPGREPTPRRSVEEVAREMGVPLRELYRRAFESIASIAFSRLKKGGLHHEIVTAFAGRIQEMSCQNPNCPTHAVYPTVYSAETHRYFCSEQCLADVEPKLPTDASSQDVVSVAESARAEVPPGSPVLTLTEIPEDFVRPRATRAGNGMDLPPSYPQLEAKGGFCWHPDWKRRTGKPRRPLA